MSGKVMMCSRAGGSPASFSLLGPRLRGGTSTAKKRGEGGFTIIEMLVALAIFSLAALALLRLQGGTLFSTARLQSGIVAGIVARNIVVEALTDAEAPTLGRTSGTEVNAGRRWAWTRVVGRTGEARLQQVTVTVADETGRQAATLTAFRSAS